MRIAIVSDTQFCNHPDRGREFKLPEADLAVVAGDFHPGLIVSLRHLDAVAAGMPVIYVAGNRDFYGHDHDVVLEEARALELQSVRLLENDGVVVDGVRFAGATLWTDYALNGKPHHRRDEILSRVNDHVAIRKGERAWSMEDAIQAHGESLEFFRYTLATSVEPVVLVSHHAPSRQSASLTHSSLHEAFVSDLSSMLAGNNGPALWIHGATHRAVDYSEGRTRIISNPLGYPGEDTGYVEGLVVDFASSPRPLP